MDANNRIREIGMTPEQRQALDEAIAEAQKWAGQVAQYSEQALLGSPEMLEALKQGHDAAVQNVVNIAKAVG